MFAVVGRGEAQAEDGVQLIVPELVVAKPGEETRLAVNFAPKIPTGQSLLLRIVGFDPRVRLLAGYRVNKGAWAVPLASAQALKFKLPDTVSEDQKVEIVLTSIDGDLVAKVGTTVRVDAGQTFASTVPASTTTQSGEVIAPKLLQEGTVQDQSARVPQQQVQQRQVQQRLAGRQTARLTTPSTTVQDRPVTQVEPEQADASPTSPPQLTPEARARAERLLRRGNGFMEQGQITQARLLFKTAAELGLAEAALALGETFDPNELSKLRVFGITPDLEEAKKWYTLAARLGSTKAADRLSATSKR